MVGDIFHSHFQYFYERHSNKLPWHMESTTRVDDTVHNESLYLTRVWYHLE